MKKTIITAAIFCALLVVNEMQAQVIITSDLDPVPTNGSVLLEFGTEAKGIILPSVASAPGAAGGTFVFDTTDNSVKVLEEKNGGTNANWTNLTENEQASGVQHSFSNSGTDVSDGVIIGSGTTTKPGILILESTTQALVLPQVSDPDLTIKGAIAGTVVYDTVSDTLAVYDGINWSYWK